MRAPQITFKSIIYKQKSLTSSSAHPIIRHPLPMPIPFKNICLSVCYRNQFKSWFKRELFCEWFHKEFVPEVKKFMRRSNLTEQSFTRT